MYFVMIIICVLIFINLYNSHKLFFGSWQSIEDFSEDGTEIYINFSENNEFRIIFVCDEKSVIYDGKAYFFTYDPRSLMLFDSTGYVKIDIEDKILPAYLYYKYSPAGYLKLYDDEKNYGEFTKIL